MFSTLKKVHLTGMSPHYPNSWDYCIRPQWQFSHLKDKYSLSPIGNHRLTYTGHSFPLCQSVWASQLLMSYVPEYSKGFQLKQPAASASPKEMTRWCYQCDHNTKRAQPLHPVHLSMSELFYVGWRRTLFWSAHSFFLCLHRVCQSAFWKDFFFLLGHFISLSSKFRAHLTLVIVLTVVQFQVKW